METVNQVADWRRFSLLRLKGAQGRTLAFVWLLRTTGGGIDEVDVRLSSFDVRWDDDDDIHPDMKSWKRRSLILLGILATVYVGVGFYFWSNQTRIIFKPMPAIVRTPDSLGVRNYQDVQFPVAKSSGEVKLDGVWIEAEKSGPRTPVILFLHGNNSTIGKDPGRIRRMHQCGHVLLFDYRGYGKSYGKIEPSEKKVNEDAEAAWDYLTEEMGIAPSRIVIYGHSLGGAIAIELASHHRDAAGLITESTFTSSLEMAGWKYGWLLDIFPMELLLEAKFNSIETIGSVQIPILFIHGEADPKVPCHMSKQLHEKASCPSELCFFPGAGHSDCGFDHPVEYHELVKGFVDRCVKETAIALAIEL